MGEAQDGEGHSRGEIGDLAVDLRPYVGGGLQIAGLHLVGLAHLAVEARWQKKDPLRAVPGSAGRKVEQRKNRSKMPEADG